MKRTTLKKAAQTYRDGITENVNDPCLRECGYEIEMAFRAGWAASTANRWPKAKVTKRRRASVNG